MADPATIAAAAKAAATALTDEGTRKKILVIAIAPLAVFILIVSLFFYILTMPLQFLGSFFSGDDYNTVQEERIEHGYDQFVERTHDDQSQEPVYLSRHIRFTEHVRHHQKDAVL